VGAPAARLNAERKLRRRDLGAFAAADRADGALKGAATKAEDRADDGWGCFRN